jgi:protein TonB
LPEQILTATGSQTGSSTPALSHLLVSADALPVAMAFSIVLHAFVLLITFSGPDSANDKFTAQLDVVLVNARSSAKPAKADALAQAHLDGGGNTQADRRAQSNLPAVRDREAADAVELAARRVQQLEQEAQRLLQLASEKALSEARDKPVRQTGARDKPNEPATEQRRMLIARLEAEIAKDWEAYQKLPRRKFIGARTEGVVYADYVDKWRQRIEAVGTANFPEEAKRRQIFGSLLITVSIKADGTVEKIEIERSSGHKVLDAAALRIVDLAGPFAPFPQPIRAQYDVLSITRNWSFTRSDLEVTIEQ